MLRLNDRFLELLPSLHLRVRPQILAPLAIHGCEAIAHKVNIDRCEWILGRRGVCGINKTEV